MPLYEFRCRDCHYLFDQMMTLYDDLPVCPLCSGPVDKLPSKPALHFKGRGFHVTDYSRHGRRRYEDI